VKQNDEAATKHRTRPVFRVYIGYHRLTFMSTSRHWLIYLFSALSVTKHSITVLSFAINVCRRFDLSPFRIVAVLTRPFCRRFGVAVFDLSPF